MGVAKLALFYLSLFTLSAAADPPSPAPAPSVDCFAVQMGLAGCLDYVTSANQSMKPPISCCDGLKNALKSDPTAAGKCLCQGLEDSPKNGITLNMPHALALPTACNVTNYSVADQCHLAPGSAAAPGHSGVTPSAPTPASPSGVPPTGSSPPVTPSGATALPPNVAPSSPSIGASSQLIASVDLLICTVIFAVFRTWFS